MEFTKEEINTEKDYEIAEKFNLTIEQVDNIPLTVVEYLRKKI